MVQLTNQVRPTLVRSTGFRIGLLLFALATLGAVGLMVMIGREQAQTPGEKNLGVAVLFMFWLPVLFMTVTGVCFLLGSTIMFARRRWKNTGQTAAPDC